jgi:hypothetical protein
MAAETEIMAIAKGGTIRQEKKRAAITCLAISKRLVVILDALTGKQARRLEQYREV